MAEEFKTLGRYVINSELGRGGFAVVYRALDPSLDREVALKVMHPSLLNDPTFTQRFRREAKALAALRHPNIITVYEVSEADGRLFIAMELVDGPSLSRFIEQRGSLPWSETLALVKPITAALDYAHSQGVIHRDLKPANIMVDRVRGPLLTDFGLARLLSNNGASLSMSMSGGILGTPTYIAPELWEMESAGPPADIYALGCIVYEMITGQLLFGGETPMQILRAHDRGPQLPAAWPEGVPAGVGDVLRKALARVPGDRYPSAGNLWHALDDANAEASAEAERARQSALVDQWRAETQSAIAAREWRVAKMALGRWLAILPGDPGALAAREEIERQQLAEQAPAAQQKPAQQEPDRQQPARKGRAQKISGLIRAEEKATAEPEVRSEAGPLPVEQKEAKVSSLREGAGQLPVRVETILAAQQVDAAQPPDTMEPDSPAARAERPAKFGKRKLSKVLLILGGVGLLGIIGLCILITSLLSAPDVSEFIYDTPVAADAASFEPTEAPQPTQATDSAEAVDPANLTGTVILWNSWPDTQTLDDITTAFSELYPGVTVERVDVPFDQYKETVETDIQAGAGPGIFIGPSEWGPAFYNAGLVMDLNGLIPGEALDPLYTVALDSTIYNGTLVALPFNMGGVVLMRNQQIIPEPASSLDELIEAAQAATYGEVYGAYIETGFFFSGAIINGLGGRLMDDYGDPAFNDEAGLEYLLVLTQIRDAGIPLAHYEDTDLDAFMNGQAGWIIDGTWNIFSAAGAIGEENLVIDTWPAPLSGYVVTDNIYISNSVHPDDLDAVAAFATFLVSAQAQEILANQPDSFNVPVLADVQISNPLQQMAVESMANGTPLPILPETTQYYGEMDVLVQNVISGNSDPASSLQTAHDNMVSTLVTFRGQ